MRVFVTGGNGFIGSVLVRSLIQQGRQVRCLLRVSSDLRRIADLEVERATGDVRDPAAVLEGMRDCEAAIHLASISNWNHMSSIEMDDVVVGGTRNILAAARQLGCGKLVYVSSSLAVCGSAKPEIFSEAAPNTLALANMGYARAKAEAEHLCRLAASAGLNVVIVNPGEVYGPNDTTLVTAGNLIDFAKSSPVWVCSGGTAVVHVDDVAAGIIAALERGRAGERYILGGDNLTVRQIAEMALEFFGQKKPIIELPNPIVRGLAWLGRNFHIPLPFNPEIIPYATRFWLMDNSKACRELGVSFRGARETLQPTVQWLREAGYVQ